MVSLKILVRYQVVNHYVGHKKRLGSLIPALWKMCCGFNRLLLFAYLRIAATPGSSVPSMYSSSAPPPVDT